MRLEGKLVVVTGASSGIGRAICRAAAERGARLVLVGRNADRLRETWGSLRQPNDHRIIVADVTQAGDRQALRERLSQEDLCLDVLINNAGVVAVGPLAGTDDHAMRQVFETNVIAPAALVRDLLPLLRAAPAARIVNIGSMFGDIAYPLFATYSASKFALRGFSDALRRELRGSRIGVTYVAPRATRTPAADAFAALVGPMGMQLDPPDVVAEAVLRAIANDARVAYPRGMERLYVFLQRLFPRLIDNAIAGQTRSPDVAAMLQTPVVAPRPWGR